MSSLYEQLTTAGGTWIDFKSLASVSAGILAGSAASGASVVIQDTIDTWAITPLRGLATWLDLLISESFVALIGPIGVGEIQAIAFISQFGVLAWLVALGMVLGGILVARYVWTEYGPGAE